MVKPAVGSWKFDEKTALQFQHIARANIPNYEAVIDRCVDIVSREFPDRRAKIIDVGSALGHTMDKFRKAGHQHVYGVENSDAMLAHAMVREHVIKSDTFPKSHGPFHAVIANWTLHFIKEREAYLRDIFDALNPSGVFILSDKMLGSEVSFDGYMSFKRSMGLSEEAIAAKTAAVTGVLVPFPVQWYLETLDRIGFTHIEIIDAHWCFNTILCRH